MVGKTISSVLISHNIHIVKQVMIKFYSTIQSIISSLKSEAFFMLKWPQYLESPSELEKPELLKMFTETSELTSSLLE